MNKETGFTAHAYGKPRDANPYPVGSQDRATWDAAWLNRDQHERDMAEALNSIGWDG